MHRLAATPGGWDSNAEGVVFIEQTPSPIVLLTAADTDISALNQVLQALPQTPPKTTAQGVPQRFNDFPDIRAVNLLQLQQQLTIDTYADEVLRHAQLIILRVLGGRAYWSYGLEVVKAIAAESKIALVVMPGDDRPDLDLMGHSTVPLAVVNQLWRYFCAGGISNIRHAFMYICDQTFATDFAPPLPEDIANIGIYKPIHEPTDTSAFSISQKAPSPSQKVLFKLLRKDASNEPSNTLIDEQALHKQALQKTRPCVGILFYKAHYLAGNTKVIDALSAALTQYGIHPVPLYVSSLKDGAIQRSLIDQCAHHSIELLINTTSFAINGLNSFTASKTETSLWHTLDVPVLQAICSGSPIEHWRAHPQGLTPRDIAMNVALPEVDGRIITRSVSFKAVQADGRQKIDAAQPKERRQIANQQANNKQRDLQTDIVIYEPQRDRVQFVAELAARWLHLHRTAPQDRKIALILANYPNRDGRMANGVGLDTPASCLNILEALQRAGYTVSKLPASGDDLMAQLARGITNDPEGYGLRPVHQSLSKQAYQQFFESLPSSVQAGVTNRWGSAAAEWERFSYQQTTEKTTNLPIAGIQFGNVFVGIQPSRGYDIDPSLNYHAPDLEPTHAYLGFYHWLRDHFNAQAVVHVGKHGNLEWLPGKGIALSENCYPEAAFGPMPHFYPFIVNDPGEGAQAKRRSQAVILDHLTPPMTRAELYGPLQQLESLVDEYYEAQNLDPSRLAVIAPKILSLLENTSLQKDLDLVSDSPIATLLTHIDGYLCELKEAQIRDGLHILGLPPQKEQARDLIIAIARHPNSQHTGLSRAIAQAWNLDIDPLTDAATQPFDNINALNVDSCRNVGDVVEKIEQYATELVGSLLGQCKHPKERLSENDEALETVTDWISDELIGLISQTTDEIDNLLHGLDGRYVPSGPSGAPTRNRPEVLPTGRNFYSVDIRAVPTESAWDVGRKAAEILIENYTQENGEYPRTLGLSMWGTSAMRTGGDDMSEALALLGVRPVWDGPSRRVTDFEILPLSLLGRPRVDVTLRISGFFRDAFPNLISLFDGAVKAVSQLDEPEDQNPLAAQVKKEFVEWREKGLDESQSLARSQYRIFGSKPGAYGAGLQGLIEAQNWESDADLARAYINWSGYAYTGNANGHSAPESFDQRLSQMEIVLQNQDNREHDLLDSDDYYQFQGGLTAAVKARRGEAPVTYFGDNAVPENPKVRSLKSEIARVYRSRVVNPKWIAGVMRHGYKGAFELSATVDYLFAYDATTHCVENHMYEGIANAYVLDAQVRKFVETSNPWALRDMAERLLEAAQRGLWTGVSEEMVDRLRAIAHDAEGNIEAGLSTI
ncbi:MAG: cobaltochelatase subunit CobN [Cyanobacteria bacterium P01_D01_bin.105]